MEILPHRLACEASWKKNVIILSDPDDDSNNIRLIKLRAKNFLHVKFHDISVVIDGCIAPTMEVVEQILEFAKTNEINIVSCFAGISRSSAVAYLIKCMSGEATEAIKCLDPSRHYPNKRIVKIGSKLLDNRDVYDVYSDWIEGL